MGGGFRYTGGMMDYEIIRSRRRTLALEITREGRLQVRDWTDKDGAKRRSHEVIVDSLYFAGSKRQSGEQAEPGDFREAPEDEEGELPF